MARAGRACGSDWGEYGVSRDVYSINTGDLWHFSIRWCGTATNRRSIALAMPQRMGAGPIVSTMSSDGLRAEVLDPMHRHASDKAHTPMTTATWIVGC